MKILVTGGAGYIGSHTCVELLNSGHDVIVADNYCNSSPVSVERIQKITGKHISVYPADLCDSQAVEDIFQRESIDGVIHFAGHKAVGESVAMPIKYYENNLVSTLNLCKAMARFGVKRLVFSSSATVYGSADSPIAEGAPLSATNPYGQTKLMIEQMLRDLQHSDPAWDIAILRYFNPIGAHPSGLIGENPRGIPNNLVPYIAQVACGRLSELSVYGNDYDTPDGTGIRDYIHVVDLALGHIRALEKLTERPGLFTCNLGTGRGTSVLEMICAYEKASGKPIPYNIVPRRPGDVAVCFADTAKAERELHWKAQKGVLEMCTDSWRWTCMNPEGYPKA